MSRKLILTLCISTVTIIQGCDKDTDNPVFKEYNFNFQSDAEGWTGDFADYPDGQDAEDFYEFSFQHSTLPAPLNIAEGALKQSGNNHSDDLFMFVKRKISGLEPEKDYTVHLEIEIATNAPDGSLGAGGSPGESVYIKAGASAIEPVKVLDNTDSWFRMNIDKGNQYGEGVNMKRIGNFSNGTENSEYVLKVLETSEPVNVRSDRNGEIWLIVGTDSGYEATTTIYYKSIKAKVE